MSAKLSKAIAASLFWDNSDSPALRPSDRQLPEVAMLQGRADYQRCAYDGRRPKAGSAGRFRIQARVPPHKVMGESRQGGDGIGGPPDLPTIAMGT
jgi:hypothetical protein